MALLEGFLITSVVGIAGGAAYSHVRLTDRKVTRDKRKLYEAMDSVPEEHRVSVGKILRIIQEQQPHEISSYRIRDILRTYDL